MGMNNINSIELVYGRTQVYTSPRMQKHPKISRLIFKIFGYTSIGNWARAHVFIDRLKLLPLKNFEKILDLGAGLGEFSFMLSEALPTTSITALEILPERVNQLKSVLETGKYPNVTVFDSKIEELGDNEQFDFIFSIDVFEHIKPEEMPFEECFKKLKPGGYFLVKIPNVNQLTICPDSWFEEHNQWLEDEHIGQVYDLNGLVDRTQKAGFKITHASYSDGWLSRVAWELSYFTAKGGAVLQLIFLPICKLIYHLEWLTFKSKKRGNAIQVIGQKVV
jgi:2-polyprenyl-3-methyl-5-hydroxy-6-metoxy-1,4-benzoquinol methylase